MNALLWFEGSAAKKGCKLYIPSTVTWVKVKGGVEVGSRNNSQVPGGVGGYNNLKLLNHFESLSKFILENPTAIIYVPTIESYIFIKAMVTYKIPYFDAKHRVKIMDPNYYNKLTGGKGAKNSVVRRDRVTKAIQAILESHYIDPNEYSDYASGKLTTIVVRRETKPIEPVETEEVSDSVQMDDVEPVNDSVKTVDNKEAEEKSAAMPNKADEIPDYGYVYVDEESMTVNINSEDSYAYNSKTNMLHLIKCGRVSGSSTQMTKGNAVENAVVCKTCLRILKADNFKLEVIKENEEAEVSMSFESGAETMTTMEKAFKDAMESNEPKQQKEDTAKTNKTNKIRITEIAKKPTIVHGKNSNNYTKVEDKPVEVKADPVRVITQEKAKVENKPKADSSTDATTRSAENWEDKISDKLAPKVKKKVDVWASHLVSVCNRYGIWAEISGSTVLVSTIAGDWKFDFTERPIELYHKNYKNTSGSIANYEYHKQDITLYSPIDALGYIIRHDQNRAERVLKEMIGG